MTTESMEFEIRAGQALATIRQLQRANSDLGKAAQMAGESAAKGNKSAEQSFKEYWAQIVKNQNQIKQLREEYNKLNQTGQSGFFTGGKGQMAIQSLAYAADDAAASFGTGGFAGALRGAANNLSMVAMMVNPLYGALAGIGLAIGGAFIKRWEDAAKAIDESGESMKKATDASAEYQRKLMSLSESIADLRGEEEKAMNLRIEARRNEMLAKPLEEKVKADQNLTEKRSALNQAIRLRDLDEGGLAGGALDANVEAARKQFSEAESRAISASGKVNKIRALLDEEDAAKREKFDKDRSAKAGERRLRQQQNIGRFAQSAVGKVDARLRTQIRTMLRGGQDVNAIVNAIRPSIEQTLGEESFGMIPGIESLAGRQASRLVGEENEKLLAMSPAQRKLGQVNEQYAAAQRAVENARIDAMKDGRMDAGEKRTIQDLQAAAGALLQAANALRDQVAEEENKLPQMDRNAGL